MYSFHQNGVEFQSVPNSSLKIAPQDKTRSHQNSHRRTKHDVNWQTDTKHEMNEKSVKRPAHPKETHTTRESAQSRLQIQASSHCIGFEQCPPISSEVFPILPVILLKLGAVITLRRSIEFPALNSRQNTSQIPPIALFHPRSYILFRNHPQNNPWIDPQS